MSMKKGVFRRPTVKVKPEGYSEEWETNMEIHRDHIRIAQTRGNFNECVVLDKAAIETLIAKYHEVGG